MGESLVGTGNCFGCAKDSHKVKEYPMIKARRKESIEAKANSPNLDALKKICFYALSCSYK